MMNRFIFLCVIFAFSISISAQNEDLQSTSSTSTVAERLFDFPFTVDDSEWRSYKSAEDRMKALQIPEELLPKIPTKELLDICLDFPYIMDIYSANKLQDGYKWLFDKFNGFSEFIGRKDAPSVLLEKVKSGLNKSVNTANVLYKRKLFYATQHLLTELMIVDDPILNQLTSIQKEQLIAALSNNSKIRSQYSSVFTSLNELPSQIFQEKLGLSPSIEKKSLSTINERVAFGKWFKRYYLRTPNNREVKNTWQLDDSDLTQSQKNELAHSLMSSYAVDSLDEATLQYNCHSYAWNVSEGGPYVWVGLFSDETQSPQSVYWSQGSYIEVPEAIATKVRYTGDHSAVIVGNGIYVSKWGRSIKCRHSKSVADPGYGIPYKYYRRTPSIAGATEFCSGYEGYSIQNMPPNSTILWASNNSCISIDSGQGTSSVIVHKQFDGIATLTATISYNGSIIATPSTSIVVGTPPLGMGMHFIISNGTHGYWASSSSTNSNLYNSFYIEEDKSHIYDRVEAELYRIDSAGNPSTLVQYWSNISTTNAQIPGYSAGWYYFQMRGVKDCGYSDWVGQEIEIVDIESLNFSMEYIASSEILTISFVNPVSSVSQLALKSDIQSSYEIQIWNSSELVRSYTTDQPSYQVSLAGLPAGVYVIRIVKDGRVYSRKFVKR